MSTPNVTLTVTFSEGVAVWHPSANRWIWLRKFKNAMRPGHFPKRIARFLRNKKKKGK